MAVKRRQTRQRQVVYETLCQNHDHPTARMVYEDTKKVLPEISLATVYRNLNLLADKGEIIKLDLGENEVHFDGDTSLHHHFYCTRCHKVIDIRIENDDLCNFERRVAEENNVSIRSSQLIFKGLCSECVNDEEELNNGIKRN